MGHIFAFVILDIAVIIVVARLFGRLARKFNQPAVIGEIVAGIALGPSLLGLLPGDVDGHLFPADVVPYLKILAQLGLVLFMFIVGLELDVALIRGRGRRAGVISLSSIVLPFALGAAATLVLHPLHDVVDGKPVSLLALMLFMGVAMSITAFPVLARILNDRGMHRTSVGVIALAAAAIDDVLAWTLLALVYAVASGNSALTVLRIVALTAVFAAVMFLVVKPLLARIPNWVQEFRADHAGHLRRRTGGNPLVRPSPRRESEYTRSSAPSSSGRSCRERGRRTSPGRFSSGSNRSACRFSCRSSSSSPDSAWT